MASRTIATVLAGLLAYVFAVAGGYVGQPDVWPIVLMISSGFLIANVVYVLIKRRNLKLVSGRMDRARQAIREQLETSSKGPPGRMVPPRSLPPAPLPRRPALLLATLLSGGVATVALGMMERAS